MLAPQFQLEHSQWWAPELLARQQLAQLRELLIHAHETVLFYRQRFAAVGFDPHRARSNRNFTMAPSESSARKRRLTREHCDELVRIPMSCTVESFNVLVACGVCLGETIR